MIKTKKEEENQEYLDVVNTLYEIFKKKNHDYGNSFEEDLDDESNLGPARYAIGNKWRRFKQLSKGVENLVGESIMDTLLDMANYCILTIMWLKKHESKGLYI